MKTHAAKIKQCNETIAAAEARIVSAQSQREKFQAAYDAAFQSAEILRAKEGRTLALVAVGEADAGAAKSVSADVAAAEAKARSFQSTIAGLNEIEAAANLAIEDARRERGVAVRGALAARVDELAVQYREQALAFANTCRSLLAVYQMRRSLNEPEDHGYTIFRSYMDADRLVLPTLNHPLFENDREGLYADALYALGPEASRPLEGKQGKAFEAELAFLRKQGLEL